MITRARSGARLTRSASGAARPNEPRVKLVELREYVSERTGRNYFSGFMGAAKVVMLRDSRADCTGKEIARWQLFVEQAPERPRTVAAPSRIEGAETPSSSAAKPTTRKKAPSRTTASDKRASDKRAAESLRAHGIDPAAPIKDDELPPW